MTNPPGAMEAVKAVYPDAYAFKWTGFWRIYNSVVGTEISDPFELEEAAWSDAASRLVPAAEVGEATEKEEVCSLCQGIVPFHSSFCMKATGYPYRPSKAAPPVAEVRAGTPQCFHISATYDSCGRLFCDRCGENIKHISPAHKDWETATVGIDDSDLAVPPVAEVVGPTDLDGLKDLVGTTKAFVRGIVEGKRITLTSLRDVFEKSVAQITGDEILDKWNEINADDGDIRVLAMLHELHELRLMTATPESSAAPPPLTEGDRWVDCKQEMPPDEVLVIVHGGVAKRLHGDWITETGMAAGRTIQWEVTHWMPMPAPPKLTASPDLEVEGDK